MQLGHDISRGYALISVAMIGLSALWASLSPAAPLPTQEKAAARNYVGAGRTVAITSSPAKSSRDADFEKFALRQDGRVEAARKKLSLAITKYQKQVTKLPVDIDVKDLLLRHLAADCSEFESSERLPRCPDLADDVSQFVRSYAEIKADVRKRLDAEKKKEKAGNGLQSVEGLQQLISLENRISNVVDGDESMTSGSQWRGQRQLADAMLTVDFTVTDRQGTLILGDLHQSMGGGSSGMHVAGRLVDGEICLETTSMIRGKNQHLILQGVVVKDRIIAAAVETTGGKAKAGSWIMLHPKKGK
jgi:hypothetical protein